MSLNEFILLHMNKQDIAIYELAVFARINEFMLNKMLKGQHRFTNAMLERVALVLKINRSTMVAYKLIDEVDHDTLKKAAEILRKNYSYQPLSEGNDIEPEEQELDYYTKQSLKMQYFLVRKRHKSSRSYHRDHGQLRNYT